MESNERLIWKAERVSGHLPTYLLVDDSDNVVARFESLAGVFCVEILGKREYSTWPTMGGSNLKMARWIESKIRECGYDFVTEGLWSGNVD
jgi:hypothetical protein